MRTEFKHTDVWLCNSVCFSEFFVLVLAPQVKIAFGWSVEFEMNQSDLVGVWRQRTVRYAKVCVTIQGTVGKKQEETINVNLRLRLRANGTLSPAETAHLCNS